MDEIHYLLGHTCNLHCDFCFWEKRTKAPTLKSAKYTIDEVIRAGISKVTISGGEPTCAPCLLGVLRYAKVNGLEIVLHTNGLGIDERKAKKIAPFLKRVSLVLDGSDEKMAVKMRKRPFTNHTLLLIDLFVSLGIPVSIKTLVTKINREDIKNIGRLLQDKPISYWSLLEFNPLGRGLVHKEKFYLPRKDFVLIAKNIVAIFPNIQIRIREFRSKPEKYCFITANEEVYTNTFKNGDILIGNLKKDSLLSIIKRAGFQT